MRQVLFITGSVSRSEQFAAAFSPYTDWEYQTSISFAEILQRLVDFPPIDIVLLDLEAPIKGLAHLVEILKVRFPHIYRFLIRGTSIPFKNRNMLEKVHASFRFPTSKNDMEDIVKQMNRFYPKQNDTVHESDTVEDEPENFYHPENETQKRLYNDLLTGDLTLNDLAFQIANDTVLSGHILRRVNSPFYGLSMKVDSPEHAVRLLGMGGVQKFLEESFGFIQFNKKIA